MLGGFQELKFDLMVDNPDLMFFYYQSNCI